MPAEPIVVSRQADPPLPDSGLVQRVGDRLRIDLPVLAFLDEGVHEQRVVLRLLLEQVEREVGSYALCRAVDDVRLLHLLVLIRTEHADERQLV
ncbi:MAG: hypothetical protein R2691_05195 [Solirubrobacterales bacterium]